MKRIFILLNFFALGWVAMADEVDFRASAPTSVVLDQPFQLVYTVNARGKDLRAPEMTDFDVLAGPYTSSSSSTSWVNGQRTSSFTQTYTYTLMAKKEGQFTIGPATIRVDKEQYSSNALRIKVLPPDEPAASQSQQGQQGGRQQESRSAADNISNENIFIRTLVNKTTVQEQECILLSYKLYTLVDVAQFTNTKLPDFTGFLKQELDQDADRQLQLEHYNGRNYSTAVLYQTLLYPQRSGDIEIPRATFEAIIRVQNRSQIRSIFDNFFDSYTNVSKTLVAPAVTIHSQPLPAGKPAAFTGGVGKFNLASSISTTQLNTNDAVTLKLTISGNGNMKLLKVPSVDFPEGFEAYDPKVSNNFKTTAAGVSGNKVIEYLAIARNDGEFVIPPVEMAYFDTQDKAYKTLRTPEYHLTVKKSGADASATPTSVYVSKEDIKSLNTDIRYIHTTPVQAAKKAAVEFGSWLFWALYLLPLLIAIALFLFFRKQIRDNQDVRRQRYKRANRVAQKRLKTAQQYMKDGNKNAFYDEIMKASWVYISDKLSIPTANLTKDNVADALRSHGATESDIEQLMQVLSNAEFARYAPANSGHEMEDLYQQTEAMIEAMEKTVR